MFEIVTHGEMDDPLVEQISRALISGAKETTIARRFNVPLATVEAIGQRCLPLLDERAQQRMRRLLVARLNALQAKFSDKALDEEDAVAGTLAVRAAETLASILGLEAPRQTINLQPIETDARSSTVRLVEALQKV